MCAHVGGLKLESRMYSRLVGRRASDGGMVWMIWKLVVGEVAKCVRAWDNAVRGGIAAVGSLAGICGGDVMMGVGGVMDGHGGTFLVERESSAFSPDDSVLRSRRGGKDKG